MDAMKIMRRLLIGYVVGAVFPAFSASEGELKYECQQGKLRRSIVIHYAQPHQTPPCDVMYIRETGQPGKVVWSAKSERGYCESQAQKLAEKLQGLGWDCLVQ